MLKEFACGRPASIFRVGDPGGVVGDPREQIDPIVVAHAKLLDFDEGGSEVSLDDCGPSRSRVGSG
jgi:hypothetical protein